MEEAQDKIDKLLPLELAAIRFVDAAEALATTGTENTTDADTVEKFRLLVEEERQAYDALLDAVRSAQA